MTVQRSPISAISSIRCEMKITAAPASTRSRRSANRRSRVATSRADVASSRMRMRGSRTSARARQQACRSLSDSRSDRRVERQAPRRAARRAPACARRRFSAAGTRPANTPSEPIQTFSSTERGSTTSTSWKTVAMPAAAARRGERRFGTVSASSSSVPASGRWTPARIFTSVDLPEPFSPTTQCTSPRRSSNEHERSACVGPNALASSVVRSAIAVGRSTSAATGAGSTGRAWAGMDRRPPPPRMTCASEPERKF